MPTAADGRNQGEFLRRKLNIRLAGWPSKGYLRLEDLRWGDLFKEVAFPTSGSCGQPTVSYAQSGPQCIVTR